MHWVEKCWAVLLLLTFAALVSTGIFWFFAPKKVDGYYLSHRQDSGQGTCVFAHWSYHLDEVAFCSADTAAAFDFMTKANAALKEQK